MLMNHQRGMMHKTTGLSGSHRYSVKITLTSMNLQLQERKETSCLYQHALSAEYKDHLARIQVIYCRIPYRMSQVTNQGKINIKTRETVFQKKQLKILA